MITINLYDYKRIIREVGIQKSLAWVAMGATLSLVLCFVIWIIQNVLIGGLESDLAEVEAKVAAATPDYNAVQALKAQQTKYGEIITGIDKLRAEQAHTTDFLEDLGHGVPEGVWLSSMKQLDLEAVMQKKVPFLFIDYDPKKKPAKPKEGEPVDTFVLVKGKAKSDLATVHLLEYLRTLPYIDAVVLHSSKRSYIEGIPVQTFEIYCHFLKPEPAA